jgi:hypothetical protein
MPGDGALEHDAFEITSPGDPIGNLVAMRERSGDGGHQPFLVGTTDGRTADSLMSVTGHVCDRHRTARIRSEKAAVIGTDRLDAPNRFR